MRTWRVLPPAPPSLPGALALTVTGQLLPSVHLPLEPLTDGLSGFVYGFTELDSADVSLMPPSFAKPLRASTVNR